MMRGSDSDGCRSGNGASTLGAVVGGEGDELGSWEEDGVTVMKQILNVYSMSLKEEETYDVSE